MSQLICPKLGLTLYCCTMQHSILFLNHVILLWVTRMFFYNHSLWAKIIQIIWEIFASLVISDCLKLQIKVFIRRGEYWFGTCFGLVLKWCKLATYHCFFSIVQVEGNTHHFIQWLIAFHIWATFPRFGNVCHLNTKGVYTIHIGRPKIQYEHCFLFWRYWGLHHSWDMHNAFVSDGSHRVRASLWKLKGALMWQISFLGQLEILSSMQCLSFLFMFKCVPLPSGDCTRYGTSQLCSVFRYNLWSEVELWYTFFYVA